MFLQESFWTLYLDALRSERTSYRLPEIPQGPMMGFPKDSLGIPKLPSDSTWVRMHLDSLRAPCMDFLAALSEFPMHSITISMKYRGVPGFLYRMHSNVKSTFLLAHSLKGLQMKFPDGLLSGIPWAPGGFLHGLSCESLQNEAVPEAPGSFLYC